MADDDPLLRIAMREAMEAYANLAGLFREGRFGEDDFRKAVMENCLVVREREAWLIDGATGRWLRYDGMSIRPVSDGGGGGAKAG